MSAVFGSSPDAVLLMAYPETSSLILKAAFEQGGLGGATDVLMTDGTKHNAVADQVGQDSTSSYIISGVLGIASRTLSEPVWPRTCRL